MEEHDDTATQNLDEESPSTPGNEGVPSEGEADDELPGVPDEAEQRLERGDE
jgi:hypothetical protein